MKRLIEDPDRFYKAQKRPSGHDIGMNFGKDNGGAIPPNLLTIPNTDSNSIYLRLCKELKLERHPARFPTDLPLFFIKMLTDVGDIVLDIFSGSNTTGYAAEKIHRNWLSIDSEKSYVKASILRFLEGLSIESADQVIKKLNTEQANFSLQSVLGDRNEEIDLGV